MLNVENGKDWIVLFKNRAWIWDIGSRDIRDALEKWLGENEY